LTDICVFFVIQQEVQEVRMDSNEILEFLFGKQAQEELARWGLPPEDEEIDQ